MELRLHEEVLKKAHEAKALIGVEPASKRKEFLTIDITVTPDEELVRLKPVLESFGVHYRCNIALRSVVSLLAARAGDFDGTKISKLKDAPGILKAYIEKVAPKTIVWRHENEHWMPYSIHSISAAHSYDADATLLMIATRHWETGNVVEETEYLDAGEVTGFTAPQVLAGVGFVIETDEILDAYGHDLDAFQALDPLVGTQVTVQGYGQYLRNWRGFAMSRDSSRESPALVEFEGKPARMVIDIHDESEKKPDAEPAHFSSFWGDSKAAQKFKAPIHPVVMCFDLKRHAHVLVNAGEIEVYQYNKGLADSLVLPEKDLKLIEILVGSKVRFKDIIESKGEGVVILSSGPPGTGKTLTAEVQGERLEQALYVVQSSQLGTKPEELEGNLRIILARATRWKAMLLIDEADVYIHERGEDLVQNAVVGVFLRLLEYYRGHLFLATNREVIVDDAIISRCAAHIKYQQPTEGARAKIWRVLAAASGLKVTAELAKTMAREWAWTSGRDIKNALKLGSMHNGKGAVTRADLNEVLAYVPRTKAEAAT